MGWKTKHKENHIEFLYRRGNECFSHGALEKAITYYQKAIKFNPRYANAHNNLGCAFSQQGRLEEAEASFRQASELEPNYAEAFGNLGATLRNRGRITESEPSLRRALEIKPDFVDALHNLSLTLTLLGRFEEAETCHRRVLEIDPNCAEALVGMSETVSHWGRFEEAEVFLQRALAVKPKLPSALSSIVSIRKMTPDDGAWLTKAEEIVKGSTDPQQETHLRFAMGKYYDDVQDYDRAFLNYRRANELSKTMGKKYERQKQTLFVDFMIQLYSRGRISKVPDGASASMRPVFIVGMPRSGTSLTEQIIASHRAAFGAGELGFWSDSINKHQIAIQDLRVGEPMLRELADAYLRLLDGFSTDAIRIVDKMPGNFAFLGLIHSVFPNARIIHMQRNPIDTCLSCYFQSFSQVFGFDKDLDDLAHYYREYHRLMAHWRAVLPPDVFLDVPYEALVNDQEKWSRKIVDFIGLDWDESCLNFHKTERRVGTASNWQVRQNIFMSSIGRWRNYDKFVGPLLDLMELHQPDSGKLPEENPAMRSPQVKASAIA